MLNGRPSLAAAIGSISTFALASSFTRKDEAMRLSAVRIICLAIATICSAHNASWAQFERLLDRVPNDANTLVIIDVEKVLATPLATREKWKDKQLDDFTQGRIFVPPQAQRLVLAGRMEIEGMDSTWQLALMDLQKPVVLEAIAAKEKGYVDVVANKKVAWTPRGAYVAKVAANSAGVLFPANRQYLSSWLRGKSGQLSPYLRRVAQQQSKSGAQVTMAIDLQDAISPELVRSRLKQFKSLTGTSVKADDVVDLVPSIRGVTLEITIGERAEGVLTVDFGGDASALASALKPALLEVLSRHGASINEFEQWKEAIEGSAFTMRGPLGASGLLRLSSVLELPSLPLDDSGRDQPKVDAGDPKLYASQQHFKSVQALLSDVRQRKGIDVKTLGQLAMWIDQYARKIDRLPLVNVDKDMQDYSAETAGLLRKLSAAYKGYGIRSGAREAQYHSGGATSSGDYGYGSYSAYGERYIQGEKRRVRAEERARAANSAVELWQAIDQASSEIRREMTERYKVEF
jgi:hypothetical protein